MASSLVAMNTASSVPGVMTRLAYRLEATALKPHWGTQPSSAPGNEPPAPAAGEGPLDALTVVAFEPLDQQVGQIQKRQHFHAVDQRVQTVRLKTISMIYLSI